MIDTETAARLLRGARALARREPADFAAAIGIGVATLKRIEAGYPTGTAMLERVADGLRRAGFEILGPTRARPDVVLGVLLLAGAEVGPEKPPKAAARPTSRKFKARKEKESESDG